jgi:hypothetical protein
MNSDHPGPLATIPTAPCPPLVECVVSLRLTRREHGPGWVWGVFDVLMENGRPACEIERLAASITDFHVAFVHKRGACGVVSPLDRL